MHGVAVEGGDIHAQIVSEVGVGGHAAGGGEFAVEFAHFRLGAVFGEDLRGVGARHHFCRGITGENAGRAERVVVVRVGEKNIVERALSKRAPHVVGDGKAGKAEARVAKDGGLAVVDEERAVARQGAHVGDL